MLARSRRFSDMDSLMHFAGTLSEPLHSGHQEPGSHVAPQDGPLRGVPLCLESEEAPAKE